MAGPLKGRSILTLKDFTPGEIRYLLDLAHKVKKQKRSGEVHSRFAGKSVALIFEKPSTRTRCAFETAIGEEGGHPVFLSLNDMQLGKKETLEDTARVLGRMFDGIQYRGFSQDIVEKLSEYSGIPVYNGLTDEFHPSQILADLMTVEEVFGALEGIKVVFVGDGRNNVAHSLVIGCAKMGVDIAVAAPKGLQPSEEIIEYSTPFAKDKGSEIFITDDVEKGIENAHVIYTDVWASMGEENKLADRIKLLKPYQVNEDLMGKTGRKETVFMHCLPAVRGNEVVDAVLDGPRSSAWEQAENRKHSIKAMMLATMGNE